jgi:hypothetical protein
MIKNYGTAVGFGHLFYRQNIRLGTNTEIFKLSKKSALP